MSSLHKVLTPATSTRDKLESTCIHADNTTVQSLTKSGVLQDSSNALGEAALLHGMEA